MIDGKFATGRVGDVDTSAAEKPNGTSWMIPLVEQIARSMEIANAINPVCWSLWGPEGYPKLAIGMKNVLAAAQLNKHDLAVLRKLIDLAALDRLGCRLNDAVNKLDPEIVGVWLNPDKLVESLELLAGPHEAAVKKMAESSGKTTRANQHDQSLVFDIEKIVGRALPQPPTGVLLSPNLLTKSNYWKISPGISGSLWESFKSDGYIAMKLFEGSIDVSDYPDELNAFKATAKSKSLKLIASPYKTLWQFAKQMKQGDKVVAYANGKVLGHGTIVGDMETVLDEVGHGQRRRVNWESVLSKALPELPKSAKDKFFSVFPLEELTKSDYEKATGSASTLPEKTFDVLGQSFREQGLSYTEPQIATFFTALQTKGFVVLSGISGTGKSKIAQGFVDFLPSTSENLETLDPIDQDFMTVNLGKAARGGNASILPSRLVALLLPDMLEGEDIQVRVVLGNRQGMAKLQRRRHSQGNLQTILRYGKDLRPLIQRQTIGTKLFLRPILDDDDDKLARVEVHLTPPTTEEMPLSEFQTVSNHLFLSVRPDWRDSTSLLGYFNPLTQEYQKTEFLKFVLRAKENFVGPTTKRIAWFVILDEMNLAHVEYYFADLLSVIESGRGKDGFTNEPLRISYPLTEEDDDFPPTEIHLPPNLYIIGTVNMDETTHAFSPKVLDRAFTIELTEVDFTDYPPLALDSVIELTDSDKQSLLQVFSRNGRFAVVSKADIVEIVGDRPDIRDWLQSLNNLLREDRFHFGYRVFDEIAQYLYNNNLNEMMTFQDAFDHAVFMKVLPKFSGSRARLKSPLLSVLAWTLDPDAPMKAAAAKEFESAMSKFEGGVIALSGEPQFPHVHGRVLQMLVSLESDGFVSFG